MSNNKSKLLWWVLGGLIGIVVVLIIVIVAINHSGQNTGDQTTDDITDLSAGEYDPAYNIATNIADIYYTKSPEEALKLYDEEINKALNENKIDMAMSLLSSKLTLLYENDDCSAIVNSYKNIDASNWPYEERLSYYSSALNSNQDCGDEEGITFYTDLLSKTLSEREYEIDESEYE